jgi:hypothetical protein
MIRECFQRIFSAKKSHDTGGPAFPFVYNDDLNRTTEIYPGMTLRDYFAAKAMEGCVPYRRKQFETDNVDMEDWDCFWNCLAQEAYGIADAMLKARQS